MVTDKFNHLQKIRNETIFNQIISNTDKYIDDNSNVEFTALQEKRKMMPGEEIDDNPISNALDKLKIETYYGAIDCIITHR